MKIRSIAGSWLGFAIVLFVGFGPVSSAARDFGPLFPGSEPLRPWFLLDPPARLRERWPGVMKSPQPSGQPISMTSGDLDHDGFPELIVGLVDGESFSCLVYRDNPEAYAPVSPDALREIAEGRFSAPFLPIPRSFDLTTRPDFVVAGDFDRDGNLDVAVAARGGGSFFLLRGDGRGGLGAAEEFFVLGRLTAFVAGELGASDSLPGLIAAIEDHGRAEVLIFDGAWNALAGEPVRIPLDAPAVALAPGALDDEIGSDLAIAAGREILVVHGSDRSRDRIELDSEPVAILASDLVWDREARSEIGAITANGWLHILERGSSDRRPWSIEEVRELRGELRLGNRIQAADRVGESAWVERSRQLVISPRALPAKAGLYPLAGNSGYGLDRDLLILDPAVGRLVVVYSPRPQKGPPSRTDERRMVSLDLGASPIAVLPMPLGAMPMDGLVILESGIPEPVVSQPMTAATVLVNTAADSNNACASSGIGICSLRDAVRFSNTNAGTDTITFAAALNGTALTLTQPNGGGNEDLSVTGDLDVNDSVTITGNGSASTIIQGGTTAANGIDKVFGINPNCDHLVSVTMTGLTIQFGRNTQAAGAPDFSDTGGGVDWCGFGTSTFSFNSSVANQNTDVNSWGGGINIDTVPGATGTVTMTGSTISANKSKSHGGGISAGGDDPVVILNGGTTVTGNSTVGGSGISDAQGGGIFIRLINNAPGTGNVQIDNATVASNTANMAGGGLCVCPGGGKQNVTIQNSSITGNTSQAGQGNPAWGGGLSNDNTSPYSTTLTNVTLSSNHADLGSAATVGGGGIFNHSGTLTMNGGALTGNTAGASNSVGRGGGVSVFGGAVTLTNSTIQNNTASAFGGALFVSAGSLTASLSRIVSNSALSGSGIAQSGGTATVTNDWWGCDGLPGAAGCQTGFGIYAANPRIDLALSASPAAVLAGGTSSVTADVTRNTSGAFLSGGNAPAVLVGLNFLFVDDPKGSLTAPLLVAIPPGGIVTKTFTAGAAPGSCGTASPSVGLDSGSQSVSITITALNQVPSLGNTLSLSKSGPSSLLFTWTDLVEATDYVVFEDVSPTGPFLPPPTGSAGTGTTGLTIPLLPASDVFYKAAGRSACGTGPLD